MILFRYGKYCMYQNQWFDFGIRENGKCVLRAGTEYKESLVKMGFYKHAGLLYILEVNPEDIQSAYRVSVWADYKGFICSVYEMKDHDIVNMAPSIEYEIMSGDRTKPGYDPQLNVKESELDDIWEERTPIEGFKFDVEPIVYLKKDGVWLVEH